MKKNTITKHKFSYLLALCAILPLKSYAQTADSTCANGTTDSTCYKGGGYITGTSYGSPPAAPITPSTPVPTNPGGSSSNGTTTCKIKTAPPLKCSYLYIEGQQDQGGGGWGGEATPNETMVNCTDTQNGQDDLYAETQNSSDDFDTHFMFFIFPPFSASGLSDSYGPIYDNNKIIGYGWNIYGNYMKQKIYSSPDQNQALDPANPSSYTTDNFCLLASMAEDVIGSSGKWFNSSSDEISYLVSDICDGSSAKKNPDGSNVCNF